MLQERQYLIEREVGFVLALGSGRICAMPLSFPKHVLFLALLALSIVPCLHAQSSTGRLTGRVLDDEGNPVAGVTVVATNQTSGDDESSTTRSDGRYSFRLRAGAYRITVAPPFEARFNAGKSAEYGVFSNLFCDRKRDKCPIIENVIIDSGERKIEFNVVDTRKDAKAGDTEKAEAKVVPDRREMRDRWRFEFPEYDRYGDKGARGRDIPFRRNAWYNPYDRNI